MFNPVRQRLVRRHPVTGRKSLYLASHIGGIVGWPVPEARAFIRDLTEHATDRASSTCTSGGATTSSYGTTADMHRVRRFDETQVRDMHRTTVAGDAPTVEQAQQVGVNGGSMKIEIVCTGDEVLTGKIVNTNFSYISQRLEDSGLSVHWGTTVGDDRESLLAAFRLASGRAEAVIVNGGLGPTVDDLSQEVRARRRRRSRLKLRSGLPQKRQDRQ